MSDIRYISASALLGLTLFSAPAAALPNTDQLISNLVYTHIHTSTLSTKPASSFAQLDKSYKISGVCFIGFGECGSSQNFSSGEDFSIDTVKQCQNEGFNITSCPFPTYPTGICPYNSNYYQACKSDNARTCKEGGYVNSCDDGYVKDGTQICSYDSSYYKCKCNPCDGYTYSYVEATADGYVADGSCNSCGTTKYKRKNNPCTGFLTCECGGEIGTPTCKSGNTEMFQTCKTCCENKCSEATCPAGYVCELESCSNKYCITGCAVNYTNWCTLPITDCGTLGYTKTTDQCPNGYLKCPYGDTVFCSNNENELNCNIGDIFYTDNTCLSPENHDTNKSALGVVIYISDEGKHGQIIAPVSLGGFYDFGDTGGTSNTNSCANTDLMDTSGEAYKAVKAYAPTPETKGKWCLPAYGLRSVIDSNQDAIEKGLSAFPEYKIYPSVFWSSTIDGYCVNAMSFDEVNRQYCGGKLDIVPVLEF